MNCAWELPLIINQTSKRKYNSISPLKEIISPPPILLSQVSSFINKHHKSHLSQIYFKSNLPTNKMHNSQQPSRKKPTRKTVLKKQQKSNTSQLSLPSLKFNQDSLIQTAFAELQTFITRYFKQQISVQVLIQKEKLSKIINYSRNKLSKSNMKLGNNQEIIFLDEAANVIYHGFKAETSLTQNNLETALYHFMRAEYYSLKLNILLFAVYCLTEQALIHRERGELQLQLQCLRKALSVSIQAQRDDITSIVFEKIGVTYYYNGNTVMGEYFHLFSQRGLSNKQAQLYIKQLNIERYLVALKKKLFDISDKSTQEEECRWKQIDLNTMNNEIQSEAIEQQHFKNLGIVSEMLKDNRSRQIGQKLQTQMFNTMKVAKVHPHKNATKNENQIKELPLINVSRVLKSHLSQNRQKTSLFKREWQLSHFYQMLI